MRDNDNGEGEWLGMRMVREGEYDAREGDTREFGMEEGTHTRTPVARWLHSRPTDVKPSQELLPGSARALSRPTDVKSCQ